MSNLKDPSQDSSSEPDSAPPRDQGVVIGKFMVIGFWLILLWLLFAGAQKWLSQTRYPNQSVSSSLIDGKRSIQLKGNRLGHYVTGGKINGLPVTFILDTGASYTSIPQTVADKLEVQRGHASQAVTANGTITVYSAIFDSVSIGGLGLEQVRGQINPHMKGEEVLLGMSFLRHFELIQRGNTLTLSAP